MMVKGIGVDLVQIPRMRRVRAVPRIIMPACVRKRILRVPCAFASGMDMEPEDVSRA